MKGIDGAGVYGVKRQVPMDRENNSQDHPHRETWLASFPEKNPNPILEIGLDGCIGYTNPAIDKIFPTLSELQSGHPYLVNWDEIVNHFRNQPEAVINREVQVGEEYFQQSINFVEEYQRLRVYGVNITERKQLETKIEESEKKYRELVFYAPSGIYEVDFRTRKFISVNEAMCILTGYSRDELMAMSPMDILDEPSQQLFKERIQKWLAGEKPEQNVDYRALAKDGHEIFAELNVTFTTDDQGKPVGAAVIGHDITERKKAEEALSEANTYLEQRVQERTAELEDLMIALKQTARELQDANIDLEAAQEELEIQNEELEGALEHEKSLRQQLILAEKNTALARLLASVAHEINNPLQTVKNSLYLLAPEVPPGEMQEIANMALYETRRIGALVQQLHETYQPHNHQPTEFNLVETLKKAFTLLGPQLKQNNVQWQIYNEHDCIFIQGIPDQIQQVCLNICLNAIDAIGPKGGQLIAEVSQPEPERACLSFHNSGPGIPESDLAHIFEPFFTTKEKGLGLGLPICYEIVKGHGGEITVESEPGKGATFFVWLPAKE
jgi:PAS domain S-box-containing protein